MWLRTRYKLQRPPHSSTIPLIGSSSSSSYGPPRIVLPGGDQVSSTWVWGAASHIQNNTCKPTPCKADSGHPENSGTKFLPSQLRIITRCGGLMPDVTNNTSKSCFFFVVCGCVWVCGVCMHSVHVSVHMWGAPVCGHQRSVPGVFYKGSSSYLLRSLAEPGAHPFSCVGWLDRICLSCALPPAWGLQMCTDVPGHHACAADVLLAEP